MNNHQKAKLAGRTRRKKRVRSRVVGTAERPRLSVFRSLKHITAQLIDDTASRTLVSVSDQSLKNKLTGVAAATAVGEAIAIKAAEKKIASAVFDRNGYRYHGQVKAMAEGARAKGLQF
ncbi:MAG: 50S ribosomal protein L18 [Patescibacteria group bacterium]